MANLCIPIPIPHEDSLRLSVSADIERSMEDLETSIERLKNEYCLFCCNSRKFREACTGMGGEITVLSETVDHVTRTSTRTNK